MPTAPDRDDVKAYLGPDHGYADDQIDGALAAETAAQMKLVKLPADPVPPADPLPYPADLAEALCRRVARNLAMRGIPLALQSTVSELGTATARVGSTDPEIRRLEGPYRKRVLA